MGETRKTVQAVSVDQVCEECSRGKMRPTGRVLLMAPALYQHKCDGCGATRNYPDRYPYTVYEPVTETLLPPGQCQNPGDCRAEICDNPNCSP